MNNSFTIAAVATPPAAGGVGILRLSGPHALAVAKPLAPSVPETPVPRHAYFTELVDAAGTLLDQGLLLYFQAPHSFTGEDVVELHAHGSPRLMQLLLAAVLADGRVRLAEPGEFTRRAFLCGKLDLTRAEAVADLVAAESEAAVRAAAAQAAGQLSSQVRALFEALLALHADIEASLDFPAEAEGADADASGRLAKVLVAAKELLASEGRGRLVRRGARVVLFGPVNAGKSTLFNRLLGEERALVDEEPGTTRDLLEARLELEGFAVTLVDTAGLRAHAPGRVEQLGIARTQAALEGADLAVLVLPPEAGPAQAAEWSTAAKHSLLVVYGKKDLLPSPPPGLAVSGRTGEGVEALRSALLGRLWEERAPSAVALVGERHADALRRVVDSLERAQKALHVSTVEAASGEVGLALDALGEITGENASQALVDAIFRRFCIGK
ncbi:MAG: tRNA uridine-5-carboxymethylaminomethyl(34) synthesis GTPase MnmE [Myxococcota bacterium]